MASKQLLFLGRGEERTEYDTARTMAAALPAQDELTVAACDLEDLVFVYDGQALQIREAVGGRDIAEYDGIFLLGWSKTKRLEDAALTVAHYAAAHDIKVWNSETFYTRSNTKLSQCAIAALNGIRVAPFVFSLNAAHLLHALQADPPAFPLIVKSVQAARGRDNYLVHSMAELEAVLTASPELCFMAQTYIPNDGDYRLVVMGDAVRVALYRRASSGTHLNNTSQGGTAQHVPVAGLDQTMCRDAVRIAQLLRREVGGVDMIIHKQTGEYYLLEVNIMPQLSTGSLVETKMAALGAYLTERMVNDD